MSRLGKLPVKLPEGVTAVLEKGILTIKGPKGELKQAIHEIISVKIEDGSLQVGVSHPESKKDKAFWGLFRSLISNMAVGVSRGFEKKLELIGVGYRAALSGRKLVINAGYSHPVEFPLPEGVDAAVEANTITLKSADKQLIGETAAQIRKIRKPEPYKGKGIKYSDEVIIRKEGKSAAKGQ